MLKRQYDIKLTSRFLKYKGAIHSHMGTEHLFCSFAGGLTCFALIIVFIFLLQNNTEFRKLETIDK